MWEKMLLTRENHPTLKTRNHSQRSTKKSAMIKPWLLKLAMSVGGRASEKPLKVMILKCICRILNKGHLAIAIRRIVHGLKSKISIDWQNIEQKWQLFEQEIFLWCPIISERIYILDILLWYTEILCKFEPCSLKVCFCLTQLQLFIAKILDWQSDRHRKYT